MKTDTEILYANVPYELHCPMKRSLLSGPKAAETPWRKDKGISLFVNLEK